MGNYLPNHFRQFPTRVCLVSPERSRAHPHYFWCPSYPSSTHEQEPISIPSRAYERCCHSDRVSTSFADRCGGIVAIPMHRDMPCDSPDCRVLFLLSLVKSPFSTYSTFRRRTTVRTCSPPAVSTAHPCRPAASLFSPVFASGRTESF